MELVEYALKYASIGWAVFPLKPRGKEPLTLHGCLDATTDEITIKKWWAKNPQANIGIATGRVSNGLFVIDVDVDDETGKDGYHELEVWQRENGMFPETWSALTGRGGNHLLFVADKPIKSKVGIIEGIDIRGEGGYIVAPPSIHPNGNTYEWEYFGSDEPPLAFMDEAVEFFLDSASLKSDSAKFEMPEVVSTGSRNDMLFRLACSLQSKGLSDVAILNAVMSENTQKCSPPLSDREVTQLVKSACAKPKGNSTGGTYDKPKQVEAVTDKKLTSLEVVSAKDLHEKDLPPIYYAVEGMIPEGETVLAAPPKTGKSWMVLDMCIAISNGEPFLGFPTNQSGTLYLALEDGEKFEQERLKMVLGDRPVPKNFYFVFKDVVPLAEGFLNQLEEIISAHRDIKVIVIDTLNFIAYRQSKNETAYACDYRTGKDLKAFAEKYGLSIIVVTHTTKLVHIEDAMANITGTNGVTGAADATIVITKEKRTDQEAQIFISGRRVRQSTHEILFMEDCRWKYLKEATDTNQKEQETIEREREYLNSSIRKAVVEIASKIEKPWKGRSKQLIETAAEFGVGIKESPKVVGGFLTSMVGMFVAIDGIHIATHKYDSASTMYEITPLSEVIDVDETPFI